MYDYKVKLMKQVPHFYISENSKLIIRVQTANVVQLDQGLRIVKIFLTWAIMNIHIYTYVLK